MAENSKIEWCHHTFNPWRGCRAISDACANCYAKVLVEGRLQQDFSARIRAAESTWKQPLAWNRKAAKEGVRYRVFCASLADVFDAEVPDEWRLDLFALIAVTPHLDWLLLTKRPKVMRDFLAAKDLDEAIGHRAFELLERMNGITAEQSAIAAGLLHGGGGHALPTSAHLVPHADAWPLPNVWLGTTVENQAMAEARIPHLLATPAAVRFLSMEPLLGPVDLTAIRHGSDPDLSVFGAQWGPDWVITGGESGPGARPTHPDWFRSLRDDCAKAGVPFLFKQWGEWRPHSGDDVFTGKVPETRWCDPRGEYPWPGPHDEDCLMQRVGKQAAGRHLDGLLHDGYPVVG